MEREDITSEVVQRLLKQQFPQWADLPIRAVEHEGSDNTTYRLGDDMSVRLPSADMYSAQVDKEHRWLPVLAPQLPLAIPQPLAKGSPTSEFNRPWSVYRWLPGAHASVDRIADPDEFAATLADFLTVLYSLDASEGPSAGLHNFWRGGPVATFDHQTREAIARIADAIDASAALEVWDAALASSWERAPVWIHGDLSASNLLVVDGKLSAVIDFGTCGVGDPACDLGITWNLFDGHERERFRDRIRMDADTWARGRGWMLWKAAITYDAAVRTGPATVEIAGLRFGWRKPALDVLADVIADHELHA